MLKINIQLFAHKKGMGSTKNGVILSPSAWAPSVLTASSSRPATSWFASAAPTSTPA